MKENRYQSYLIRKINEMFPNCIVLKNDANYIQGIPDLLILYREHWAALETKRSAKENHQPNQDYYIDILDDMSYAAFIYPENEREVLCEIQQIFSSRR